LSFLFPPSLLSPLFEAMGEKEMLLLFSFFLPFSSLGLRDEGSALVFSPLPFFPLPSSHPPLGD